MDSLTASILIVAVVMIATFGAAYGVGNIIASMEEEHFDHE